MTATALFATAGLPSAASATSIDESSYVHRSYVDVLERPPTSGELADAQELLAMPNGRGAFAAALTGGERGVPVAVERAFRNALDRDADPVGLAYWVGRVRRGAPLSSVSAELMGSREFWRRIALQQPDRFAAQVYGRAVGRRPDRAGRARMLDVLSRRGRTAAASMVVTSHEARSKRVRSRFEVLACATPSTTTLDRWTEALRSVDELALVSAIVSSDRYHDRTTLACPISLVGRNPAGTAADDGTSEPAMSADGRYVVFTSTATNLVPDVEQPQHGSNVYLLDRVTGKVTWVSRSKDPTEVGSANAPSISDDGRWVVYASAAETIVPGDANMALDIFRFDRLSGKNERISVDPAGHDLHNNSWTPDVSNDGRFVTYSSDADGVVPDDTNGAADVFLWDATTRQTVLVSAAPGRQPADGQSQSPAISGDGRYVAYSTYATNLAGTDTNDNFDVVVWDRTTGSTTRLTNGSTKGAERVGASEPEISSDGSSITFFSDQYDLVSGDTNDTEDVFVWDRSTGTTQMVTAGAGHGANGGSWYPTISPDGRWIAFSSFASDLVPGDDNGVMDGFLWDRQGNSIIRFNPPSGSAGIGIEDYTVVDGAGRFVAFVSNQSDITPGDTNHMQDVFFWERPAAASP